VKSYYATPSSTCFAPARGFQGLLEAVRFAREAADRFRAAYVLWQRHGSSWRILARFSPRPRAG
jgi:hypothetical protein